MKNLVKKYLLLNRHEEKTEEFEDLFQSHPNYPSVFAITDTFNLLSIENVALKIPKEQIEELPKEFLAIYKSKIVLVYKSKESIKLENDLLVKSEISYSEFLENWEGIIIAIEPNTNIKITSKNNTSWFLYSLPILALLTLSIYFNKHNFYSVFTLAISVIGIIISFFILQEKFGINNSITAKFCNSNSNLSCTSVIKSQNSNNNYLINFTDLPILFFGISFIANVLLPNASSIIIGFVSVVSLPVILYSIWIQKFELKKWCVLCLVVSVLIITQSILYFLFNDFESILKQNFSVFLVTTIFISSIWLFLKPQFEKKSKLESENIHLHKFKRNFTVFEILSEEIEEYDDFEKLKGITFGNKKAITQLTLILSPSCGHCHNAFEDAYTLIQKFPEKIFLTILFNINANNNDNPYKIVVENLLTINEQNPKLAQEALIDWHINKLTLENWVRKWNTETPHMLVNQHIQNQYHWCVKNEFNFTPVKIINDKLYPSGYEIHELRYFINDFQQLSDTNESLKAV
ncbi:vitamin K epoxide reductase family protein [Flavobacterium urocaniciphilum]|uniref:Vitamin K epoxide reductase family protein n=1 Tax=Flavobacterium urocaniciphilum TaxID=1299341 RepID=A0A1H9DUC4_9FLAO|nr:vitamin K epoxide reductase family protein [Flavobacterium urocaniciphilum]SEQ17042.1 Vitamin K epoxide reductase family protein [Flavobacterium urocaniciphilum]